MHKFVVIEGCNFDNFPAGGQLTFVRQLMRAFGSQIALVGVATDETPVGVWTKKSVEGVEYDFFAYQRRKPSSARPILPARLTGLMALRRYRRQIMAEGRLHYFVQSHELLPLVLGWSHRSVCFCFPGVENPLAISRYKWAKFVAYAFDQWFLRAAKRADVLLAAADGNAINQLKQRCGGLLLERQISSFPTRVCTRLFHRGGKGPGRERLGLESGSTVVVTTGRIHWAKGWAFLLDAFVRFLDEDPSAKMVFVGDGEDRCRLEARAMELGISDRVIVTGHVDPTLVAEYLRASDLFVLGSISEGWSTSLVEALATSLPIVTTNVSSSCEIVRSGVNGYILNDRDHERFAEAMQKALLLDLCEVHAYSSIEVSKYSVDRLGHDLESLWLRG